MSYDKHTWVDNETITATKLNNIEDGIKEAAQSGGGDKFSAYDYVITQVDSGTPTLIKGTFNDIYDKLQAMEAVSGLYVRNTTPGQWNDTVCECYPLPYANYYSSRDLIFSRGLYDPGTGTWKTLLIEIPRTGTIVVNRISE